ncbi:MAG: rhomboid family intramembrane serine protease [Desulfuromonadales bacterium]|nr:rhomboid family intramembrane serine protease [Desulfuromonadales bacterium]
MKFIFCIALLAGLVTASADLSGAASLDVARVVSGEVWRMVSGHLTHLTWRQYITDVPAFVFLYGAYIRRSGTVSGVLLALFSAVSVSGVVIIAGVHQLYGGLSGVSCAAFAAILLVWIMEHPRRMANYLVAAVFCAFLLSMGGVASGVRVAKEAHIAGAVTGAIFELLRVWLLGGCVSGSGPGRVFHSACKATPSGH